MGISSPKPVAFDHSIHSIAIALTSCLKKLGAGAVIDTENFIGDRDEENQKIKGSWKVMITYKLKHNEQDVENVIYVFNAYTHNGVNKSARLKLEDHSESHDFSTEGELKQIVNGIFNKKYGTVTTKSELWATLDKLATIAMHLHACKQQSSLT